MRKPMIAGNWKMNKTVKETKDFITKLKKHALPKNKDILICPPFTALSKASGLIKGSNIQLGAQNMHYEVAGAFTGEISPLMLKELGCKYVILGHSERRHIFNEDDSLINRKIKAALNLKLKPILCIGETLDQRKKNKTEEIVKSQLLNSLKDIKDISNIILAYEPVWAIGTGINAAPEQAEEIHKMIRTLIKKTYSPKAANDIRILYGGSVKPENIKELMKEQDIDGALVGGASLDTDKFFKLIN